MPALEILFAAAAMLVFYTYGGYPMVLALLPRRIEEMAEPPSSPVCDGAELPSVTILIPAYNEERWIARKIENTLELDYPGERLEIVVASDGSQDGTAEIARGYATRGVTVAAFPKRLGKQEMLNRLVPGAPGEIVVMTDANAILERGSLRALVRPFTDPEVGCAIGRRVCIVQERSVPSVAESLYWRYESWIK